MIMTHTRRICYVTYDLHISVSEQTVARCKEIQDFDSGFHAVHSRFFVSGTWVPHPVVSGIPDSTSKNFPDSTTWDENRNTRLRVP